VESRLWDSFAVMCQVTHPSPLGRQRLPPESYPASQTHILEDGPELPKSSGPHAEEGGEVLEGMYAQGCTTIEESRIGVGKRRAGGLDTASWSGSMASALAMSNRSQYLTT
jgi:hypothetical protein